MNGIKIPSKIQQQQQYLPRHSGFRTVPIDLNYHCGEIYFLNLQFSLYCKMCQKYFQEFQEFSVHIISNHVAKNERPPDPEIQQPQTIPNDGRLEHITIEILPNLLTNKDKKQLSCNKCSAILTDHYEYEEHINSQLNYICEICGEYFCSEILLDLHIKGHIHINSTSRIKPAATTKNTIRKMHNKTNPIACDPDEIAEIANLHVQLVDQIKKDELIQETSVYLSSKDSQYSFGGESASTSTASMEVEKINVLLYEDDDDDDGGNDIDMTNNSQIDESFEQKSLIIKKPIDRITNPVNLDNLNLYLTGENETKWKCKLCPKIFQEEKKFIAHLKSIQQSRCQICEHYYCRKCDLDVHMKTHSLEKPFECDICSFSCKTNSTLKDHIKTHLNEKLYQCGICERRFNTRVICRTHQRTHLAVKPFKCDYCEKRFCQNFERKQHERIHTGEKPNQCDLCGMTFLNSQKLKAHKFRHYNERCYACDQCDKKFYEKHYLKNHKISHSGDKKFKCDFCTARFPRNNSLRRHLKTLHPTELAGEFN